MDEVADVIKTLQGKGWTLAALGDELGVRWLTVRRWREGEHPPANPIAVLMLLRQLERRKRVPKRKRRGPAGGTVRNS